MKNPFNKPENQFLVIGFIFGILFLIITPPFQAADEDRHFFRAYQIAEGGWIPAVHEGQAGGWLPKSVVKAGFSTYPMRWKRDQKTTRQDTLSLFQEPLNSSDREFREFRSAIYTPVAYLPAAAVIRIGIWCRCSPILLMYFGRVVNLIGWLLLIGTAIRIVPFYKWVFAALALMPMTLYQGASLSADSITIGLAFLTIATFVYWITGSQDRIHVRHMLLFFVLTIALSSAKNVFFLMSFLSLLIPACRFRDKKSYWLFAAGLVAANFAACYLWYQVVKNMPIVWKPGVYPDQQIAFIMSHPAAYLKIFIINFFRHIEYHMKTFIGRFGWMDTPLPKLHYHVWGLFLLILVLTDGYRDMAVRCIRKLVFLLVFAAVCGLVITLMYIYWNPVGAEEMLPLQGRYFIPIAPLFLLCFYNRRLAWHPRSKPILFALLTTLSLANTLWVLYYRFYIP